MLRRWSSTSQAVRLESAYQITQLDPWSGWFPDFTKHRIVDGGVQLLSHVRLFVTPWTSACHTSLYIANTWSLLKLMSIESVIPPNHLILCHPLLLLPSIFPSIRVFSNESILHIRWPKYWSFSISSSSEYSGLISLGLTGWISCQQESSPTPQFKGIKSQVLSFLYSPTLISIHDNWKNHTFDQLGLCWQSNVSAF